MNVEVEETPIKPQTNKRKYTDDELRELRRNQGRLLAQRRREGEFSKPLSTWKELSQYARQYGLRQSEGGEKKSKAKLRKEIVYLMDANNVDTTLIKECWKF